MVNIPPSYEESRKTNDSSHAILSRKSKLPVSIGRKVPPLPPTCQLWDAVCTFSAFCLKLIHILGSLKGLLSLFARGVHVPFYTLPWGPYSYYLSLFKAYMLFIQKDHEVRIFRSMAKALPLTITDHPEHYPLKCPLLILCICLFAFFFFLRKGSDLKVSFLQYNILLNIQQHSDMMFSAH